MFNRDIDNEKQHINLSDDAWFIIDDDIRNFYTYEDKESFSGFMNTIFINFCEDAEATFSSRREEYRETLNAILGEFPENSATKQKLIAAYIANLKKKALSYPKGEGRKFRLNKKSQALLENHPDNIDYKGIRGDYLKAVFEEYATLPTYKREQIFFKDIIDEINNAISLNKKLRISLMSKSGQSSYSKFSVKPYAVRQDKTKSFNYLICYSTLLNDKNETIAEEKISCFRLSRIENIKALSKSFISKESRLEIEKALRERGVQFMAGEIIDVTVAFTPKGYDDFNRQSYMRPQSYDKLNDLTYVFHCTEFQALSYFFRLGKDACIISPDRLHTEMLNRFASALATYKGSDI